MRFLTCDPLTSIQSRNARDSSAPNGVQTLLYAVGSAARKAATIRVTTSTSRQPLPWLSM